MHIYVDETKQRDYLLVASVHVSTDLTGLRQMVRGLLLPGQRYLHMKDEKDGRKRTIAQAFVDAGVQATVYRAGPQHRNERQRRSACLQALVDDHAGLGEAHIILDEDETMVKFDNQKLIDISRWRNGIHDVHDDCEFAAQASVMVNLSTVAPRRWRYLFWFGLGKLRFCCLGFDRDVSWCSRLGGSRRW